MTEFVFRKKKSNGGELEFLGDFEGLYRSEEDPWGQSGGGADLLMNEFYKRSREILCNRIAEIHRSIDAQSQRLNLCEIGSGTGFLTSMLKKTLPSANICGVDVSKTAIDKAKLQFPSIEFYCHDILIGGGLGAKFDTVILSNLLWYVIHDLDNLIANVVKSIKKNNQESFLVVQNALFKNDQCYGSDVISTIGSMTDMFIKKLSNKVEILTVSSELHRSPDMCHDFGLVIIKLQIL
jgi:SAM-dependent methyltransferase